MNHNTHSTRPPLWFTWENQRRNKELSDAFDAKYLAYMHNKSGRLERYLRSSLATLEALRKEKPQFVFAQFPSLILCSLLAFLKPYFSYTLCIDAHNAMIRFFHHNTFLIKFLTRYTAKKADFIIVSNKELLIKLAPYENKVLVLPDRLPKLLEKKEAPEQFHPTKKNVVYISSFAEDEPTEAFLRATTSYHDSARFFVTGKKQNAGSLLSFESENIIFTDFLSEEDFDNMLHHADLAIDLSTDDNCLVCGAYEALSAHTPCIISDSKASRSTFDEGFLFTKNDEESIKKTLEDSLKRLQDISEQAPLGAVSFQKRWEKHLKEVKSRVCAS